MSKPIPYTSGSINPVGGCVRYSRGCNACYGFTWAQRFRGGDFSIKYFPAKLDVIRRKKGGLWFVGSMTDLFQDGITVSKVVEIMDTISENQKATFLVLTKRASNMAKFFAEYPPPMNLGIGVTAEGQLEWDARVPILLSIKAAMRFVSVEPMLESIDITKRTQNQRLGCKIQRSLPDDLGCHHGQNLAGIDFIAVGPETGAGKRPHDPRWIESVINQCRSLGISAFDKRTPYLCREWPKGWKP